MLMTGSIEQEANKSISFFIFFFSAAAIGIK